MRKGAFMDGINMKRRKPGSHEVFLCNDDCETSVSMRLRCKRKYIWMGLVLSLSISIVVNVIILQRHRQRISEQVFDFESPNVRETGNNDLIKQKSPFISGKSQKSQTFEARSAQKTATSVGEGKNAFKPNSRIKGKNKRPQDDSIVPRAQSLAPNATASACLLVKDDNDILPEWLSYHYHALGLRDLIVAIDPLSRESPSDILMRWRLMTDLKILEWTDQDFMPDEFRTTQRPPEKYMQKEEDFPDPDARLEISNHRYRQRVFLSKCLQRFRKDGKTWVLHTDTDEFIVPSKLLRQMKPKYLRIPSMDEPNGVLSLIKQTVEKTAKQVNYPCMSLLRVLFGSVESLEEERDLDAPSPFRAEQFETLRWRHHALPHNMTFNGNPKVLIDVSAIPSKYFKGDVVFSIHRPVQKFCHSNNDLEFTRFRHQPIGVNHYLGSWERYSARNDKRRSKSVYDAKAYVKRGTDDGVRLWLKGFVNSVGLETAETLLGRSYLQQSEESKDRS